MSSILTPTPPSDARNAVARFDKPLWWDATAEAVVFLDQRVLPTRIVTLSVTSIPAMVLAIRDMVVRGAPAIGLAGAYGLVFALTANSNCPASDCLPALEAARNTLDAARPTAVNLHWALMQQWDHATQWVAQHPEGSEQQLREALLANAIALHDADIACCKAMGEHGAALLPTHAKVLTHCNTGFLATGGFGTALGVIRAAQAHGKIAQVFADETRPRLQGARLTAWELAQDNIPVTLISDGMAAWLMRTQQIDAVLIGADRIAANGDTANKIGSYHLALAAHAHGVPFYVVAPTATIDFTLPNGSGIPIEARDPREVREIEGIALTAPTGVSVWNPAFDVTPAHYISRIITETGVYPADGLKNQQLC